MTAATRSQLDPADIEQFGVELDDIYQSTIADLGQRDEQYIKRLIRFQRSLALGSRVAILAGAALRPRGFAGRKTGVGGHRPGTALLGLGAVGLGLAKILENMEIGHNVMHGQWDWMNDPQINSTVWEWDTVASADHWKHGHNIVHHTWTNVLGMDRDIGYEIMRTRSAQRWNPAYLAQPIYNTLLAVLFEWGVGVHEVDLEKLATGTRQERAVELRTFRAFLRKARRQVAKDYVLWPALAGPGFLTVAAADAVANVIRNLWSYMIIFCGHFPDDVHVFARRDIENETRADWYIRQILGSANITGRPIFHVLAGNLSHQIEHHLFPDMPSLRYQRVAPRVQALCTRYGLPYNSHPLRRQFGTTTRKIWRYSLPGGQDATPKISTPPLSSRAGAST